MNVPTLLGGCVVGCIGSGLLGFALRPAPSVPDPTPRMEAPERTRVRLDCPERPEFGSERTDAALAEVQAQVAFLKGRIAMEVGDDLEPQRPGEAEGPVRAHLESILPDGAHLWLDCSAHPCRGRVALAAWNDIDEMVDVMQEKENFWADLRGPYPGTAIRDGIDLEGGVFTLTFVVSEAVETKGRQKRLLWLADHVAPTPE